MLATQENTDQDVEEDHAGDTNRQKTQHTDPDVEEDHAGDCHGERATTLARPAVEHEGLVVVLPRFLRRHEAEQQLLDGIELLHGETGVSQVQQSPHGQQRSCTHSASLMLRLHGCN